jgi:hypothetical protein
MATYTYQRIADGSSVVLRSDGALVTLGTPAWTDYLSWLSVGNQPTAADTSPPVMPVPIPTVPQMVFLVDDAVASVYSNWTRFQQEYISRQEAAQAFKDANYQGTPGVWITAFATAVGISNQVAADTILAQSVSLNTALQTLGALRMRKYEISSAKDFPTAQASFKDIISKIKQVAASLS